MTTTAPSCDLSDPVCDLCEQRAEYQVSVSIMGGTRSGEIIDNYQLCSYHLQQMGLSPVKKEF